MDANAANVLLLYYIDVGGFRGESVSPFTTTFSNLRASGVCGRHYAAGGRWTRRPSATAWRIAL